MTRPDFARFWASQPRFDPFIPAGTPRWCPQSRPFADWCLRLVAAVGEDPTPDKVAYAKVKLVDYYCRAHAKTTAEHRAETNLDNHPCLHQVLLIAWNELEEADLRRAVPELSPPAQVIPLETISPADEDKVYAEQETGIIIGIGEGEGEES